MNVAIEPETAADEEAIRSLIVAAFDGRTEEADLVDELRDSGDLLLSLVARHQGEVVGHIAFSRVVIEEAHQLSGGVALAPIGVRPDLQNQGIGGELIEQGLALLEVGGETVVLVVGSPAYYSRFGFSTAAAERYPSVYSGAYYLARELREATSLSGGAVSYPDAFELVS